MMRRRYLYAPTILGAVFALLTSSTPSPLFGAQQVDFTIAVSESFSDDSGHAFSVSIPTYRPAGRTDTFVTPSGDVFFVPPPISGGIKFSSLQAAIDYVSGDWIYQTMVDG